MLPVIEHAEVTTNEVGRINITMKEGWLFYDLNDYETIENIEEYSYSNAGYNYPINYDFSKIKVVKDGTPIEPETNEEVEKAAALDILLGVSE